MNKIGFHDEVEPDKTLKDAFNYPTLNRKMLMSLKSITTIDDFVNTSTKRFHTSRRFSTNLET